MEVVINNLVFGYDNLLFDNFNLTIHNNTFTSILGKNGCGMTSLVKILIDEVKYSGQIKYDNLIMNEDNKEKIMGKISVITNYNDMFIYEDVYNDLVFSLEKSGYASSIIDDTISDLLKDLNLEYLIYKKNNELSESEKELVMLLCMIVNKPNLLILDNSLNNIEYNMKTKIINYLRNQELTVINITNNVEDILLSDEIVIIDDKKCISYNNINKLNEEILNKNNLKLPFMIDLSNKLKYYDLIDKIYIDKKELVDEVWK